MMAKEKLMTDEQAENFARVICATARVVRNYIQEHKDAYQDFLNHYGDKERGDFDESRYFV